MDRNIRKNIQTKKQINITEGIGYPSISDGSESDITIRSIPSKGVYLFTKFRGIWFGTQMSTIKEIKNG